MFISLVKIGQMGVRTIGYLIHLVTFHGKEGSVKHILRIGQGVHYIATLPVDG